MSTDGVSRDFFICRTRWFRLRVLRILLVSMYEDDCVILELFIDTRGKKDILLVPSLLADMILLLNSRYVLFDFNSLNL